MSNELMLSDATTSHIIVAAKQLQLTKQINMVLVLQ